MGSRVEGTMLENNYFLGGSRGRGVDLGIILGGVDGRGQKSKKINYIFSTFRE